MPTKDAYYFSHDSNARNDLKMVKLRRVMGLEGYGIFWCIIEILRETNEYKLSISSLDDIAFDLGITVDKLKAVINDFELFSIEDSQFYSKRLMQSMTEYKSFKDRLSAAGKKSASKRWKDNSDKGGGFVL